MHKAALMLLQRILECENVSGPSRDGPQPVKFKETEMDVDLPQVDLMNKKITQTAVINIVFQRIFYMT